MSSATAAVAAAALPAGYVSQGGLTWMPVTFSKNWTDANAYCTGTTINGETGWRLPSKTNLSGLYASGAMNGQGWTLGRTWSSTVNGPDHDYVNLNDGTVGKQRNLFTHYVTCVRLEP